MELNKAKSGDRIYTVVSEHDFINADKRTKDPYLAVRQGDRIYPERKLDNMEVTQPGVYDCGAFVRYVDPVTPEDEQEMSADNIIDFNKDNIKGLIESSNLLKMKEREILTSSDNVTLVSVGEMDDPEMKALKTAIQEKHIDIDKYEPRFGDNFNNDKRLLSKSKITITKLKTMCKNLDIKATLILEDASDDTPNPIGRQIVVELVEGEE